MTQQLRSLATAIAVVATLLFTVTNARIVFALPAADQACRATVAKEVGSHLKKVLKTISKCHVGRAKGKVALTVNCNDLAEADPLSTLASSRSHATSAINAACGSAPNSVANYARCPSPAADVDDAGTAGIDSSAELGACMVALIEDLSQQAMREVAGLARVKPTKSVGGCQKTLTKSASKAMSTILKERSACQGGLDMTSNSFAYACGGSDPSGKIQASLDKANAAIAKKCNVDDDPSVPIKRELDVLNACADDVAGLQRCVVDAVVSHMGPGMAAMAYELPSTCKAGSVLRVLQSGAGDEFTDTFLSTGWTGVSHLVDVLDDARETVLTTCDADCANCTMNLDPRKGQPDAICRCGLDPTNDCDVFNGVDIDDCGLLDTCNCNFGAPLPLSSGGVPVCVLNRHRSDLTNTSIDLGTGLQSGTVNDTATIFLGENTQVQPCPICDGDDTPNDGNRDGTCSAGLRLNQACDTNAVHPDFGPTSHDCPPNLVTNISGSGLVLAQPFSTFPQTMESHLPCTAPPGTLCPCLVCTNDELRGCTSNADCVSPGTCTTVGSQASAATQPNDCADGICTCDDDVCSGGTCLAGPSEKFCDAIVRQNGRGFLQCNTDVDCIAINAGNCTITQLRPCAPDPIEIDGSATMFTANDSALFCIPATNSAAVNNSAGLPGPGIVTLSAELTTMCASDPTVAFEPPGGSNCP